MAEEPRYPELHVDVPLDEVDDASALLFELGASGVEERDEGTLVKGPAAGVATLVASFSDRESAEAASREIDPAWSPRVAELVGDAWRDEWKKHFAPFKLTERITIRPPWEAYERRDPSEIVLELEPGRAFGTGLHATTALVARALEALGPRVANSEVLDVGTGSGILALVAVALGASHARAIDVDPEAVLVTIENARRNGYDRRIAASATPLADVEGTFDVVVANIEARVLVDLSSALDARVRPGGALVLSGILVGQEADVMRAFGAYRTNGVPRENEWIALVLEKDPLSL
jgi:ribosomal protein L11 methyltransferase